MRVLFPVLALAFFCSVVTAEFSLVTEFHGRDEFSDYGYEIDMDGDYAVVGAYHALDESGAGSGAAHVLHRGSGGWEEVQVLYGAPGDNFGIDVAISGDWIAVGASLGEAVYMYKRNSSSVFEFKQRVVSQDPRGREFFGWRVSMDAGLLIVGAPDSDNQGAVFVFRRAGNTWLVDFVDRGSDDNGKLGYTVAISGDYAFGGAFQGDSSPSDPGNDQAGVVLVYHRSAAGEWSMDQVLTATSPDTGEQFSRGLDADGDLLAVGVRFPSNDNSTVRVAGELIIFRRNSDGQYESEAVFPGPTTHLTHGTRVAVAHGVVAAGSSLGFLPGTAGLARIYQQVDGNWTATHTLHGTDVGANSNSYFSRGLALEVTGTHATLIAGGYAHTDTEGENVESAGAAWVFEDPTITVEEPAEFTVVGEFHSKNQSDNLGYEVDVSGDYAVAGAYFRRNNTADSNAPRPGAAHVLHRGSNGWEEVQVLHGEDHTDYFGFDVAISGDWIAVGAPLSDSDSGPVDSGSAYLYKKNGAGVFEFKQRLVDPEPDTSDRFGWRVSTDGDRLIVGAPFGENETSTAVGDTFSDQGSVFIFERTGDTWSLVFADHGSDGDGQLGYTVAISGDYAFGGAIFGDSSPSEPGNDQAGVALVYHRSETGEWSMVQSLTALTPGTHEFFARGLDADGDLLAAGLLQPTDSDTRYEGELSIFRRNGSGLYELDTVFPGPTTHFYHGLRVSVSRGVIAAGSLQAIDGSAGFVAVYQQVDGIWTATHIVDGTQPEVDAAPGSFFTRGLALDVTCTRATLIVGAHLQADQAGAAWVLENPGIATCDNTEPPASAAQWSAPCGCDGLGAAPIVAHAADSTSVTLSFDATPPDNAPCVAEPVP